MAKISSFMICESVMNIQMPQGESVPQLHAPLSVLRPPYIPGSYSFGISLGITGASFTSDNKVRLGILSPDGTEIFNSGEINLGKIPEEKIIPLQYQGFVLTTDIRNLVFPREGLYYAEVTINGESAGKHPFPVYRKGEQ